ncbi:MAG: GntR family transcriptional regulator [Paracoccus sp. (in: a-proteobacteria)]|nr:GntR family transcriptional regulator [Paracoccus sp. (in: a-proteobacteria)]
MNEAQAAATRGIKAHRIFLLLKDAINSGRIAAGEKLPGEISLAEQHSVSRVTVRRAMAALSEAGLVTRRAGIGTVVLEQPLNTTLTGSVESLLPNKQKLNEASSVRLLEFRYIEAVGTVRDRLALTPRERVQRSIRVRSTNGIPFGYLVTHVPERLALNYVESDLATQPLYALLERSGVKVSHATQTISAVLADPEVARALEVAVGSPLISLSRVTRDEEGRGVQCLEALYRPDRYQLQIELVRSGSGTERSWESVPGEQEHTPSEPAAAQP